MQATKDRIELSTRVNPTNLHQAKIKSVELSTTYSIYIESALNTLVTNPDIHDLKSLQENCPLTANLASGPRAWPRGRGRPPKTAAPSIKKKFLIYISPVTFKNIKRFQRKTFLCISDIVDLAIQIQLSSPK